MALSRQIRFVIVDHGLKFGLAFVKSSNLEKGLEQMFCRTEKTYREELSALWGLLQMHLLRQGLILRTPSHFHSSG